MLLRGIGSEFLLDLRVDDLRTLQVCAKGVHKATLAVRAPLKFALLASMPPGWEIGSPRISKERSRILECRNMGSHKHKNAFMKMRIHYASECLLELISKERICFDRRDVCKMQVDGNV